MRRRADSMADGNTTTDGGTGAPNQRWRLGFPSDQLTDECRFRILAVVADCTRECLVPAADTSLSFLLVARELDAVVRDNGTEFTSNAILAWVDETCID